MKVCEITGSRRNNLDDLIIDTLDTSHQQQIKPIARPRATGHKGPSIFNVSIDAGRGAATTRGAATDVHEDGADAATDADRGTTSMVQNISLNIQDSDDDSVIHFPETSTKDAIGADRTTAEKIPRSRKNKVAPLPALPGTGSQHNPIQVTGQTQV